MKKTLLVTYDNNAIYVLDPGLGTFVGYHTNVGPILDLVVSKDEIFILRKAVHGKIMRLSKRPALVNVAGMYVHAIFTGNILLCEFIMSNMFSRCKFTNAFIYFIQYISLITYSFSGSSLSNSMVSPNLTEQEDPSSSPIRQNKMPIDDKSPVDILSTNC